MRLRDSNRGKEEDASAISPDEFFEFSGGFIARKGPFVFMQKTQTPEEYAAFLEKVRKEGGKLRDKIDKNVAELRRRLLKMPVRPTLSNLALLVFLANPETYKEYEQAFQSIVVEYPTWLYATSEEDSVVISGVLDPQDFQSLLKLLKETLDLTISQYAFDSVAAGEKPNAFEEIRFRTRNHNLLVRSLSYPHHLRTQLHALFDPFEEELRHTVGFSIRETLQVFDAMKRLVNERLNDIIKKASVAARNNAVSKIINVVSTGAEDIFHFKIEDLSSASCLEEDLVRKILDRFSSTFSQTPIADNWPSVYEPIEQAPLLRFSDGTYLGNLVVKLTSAAKMNLEAALRKESKIWNRYEQSRAKYLESRAVTMIASVSKHARKWTRLQYVFDDGCGPIPYELDGLVLVDNTFFLIEAKAGSISYAARRGADSAISELKNLVGEAQTQTNRALRYLKSRNEVRFSTREGEVVFRHADFSRVYLITVTLDSLSAFVTHIAGLKQLGLLKEKEISWSVYELDLQVVMEIVEGVGQLVHFLDRRLATEKLNVMAFDELDWFGCYLHKGLWLEEFFKDGKLTRLVVTSHTEPIDNYYLYVCGLRKTPAERPRQLMPHALRGLIRNLETIGPGGFVDAVCMLLDLDSKTRFGFAEQMKDRRVRGREGVFSAFRMKLDDNRVLCYLSAGKASQRLVDDYTNAAKYDMKSDYAVGIAQSGDKTWSDVLVSAQRYPWKEDESMAALANDFFSLVVSRRIDSEK